MFRLRLNVGPKSIFFFVVFCAFLFLSLNWKLSYVVTKDYVEKTQKERALRTQRDIAAEQPSYEKRHRRLVPEEAK